MPDLPKYIGIEGSHTDFAYGDDPETIGNYSQMVAGTEYPKVSAALNNAFAGSNHLFDDEAYPHISDMYVRTRDVMPLLKLARKLPDVLKSLGFVQGDATLAEVERCLDYLKDLE